MSKPKPRVYRTPKTKRSAQKWHNSDSERVYANGRRVPLKMMADLDPDTASVRCGAPLASGTCRRWAVVGGTRCHSHGGHRRHRRKNCSAVECSLKYPHRAWSKGCARERPGIIMGPPPQPVSTWTLTPRLLSPLGR